MSTDQFNRKVQQSQKIITSIRKDMKYREQQTKRNEATYSIDAEIKGQFLELEECLGRLEQWLSSYKSNPKDYGLSNKEVDVRSKQYQKLSGQRGSIKRMYDSYFEKKAREDLIGNGPQAQSAQQKFNTQNMNSKQLYDLKQKQEQQQDQAIDGLIDVVKNIKTGGQAINKQLTQQDQMLNELDEGIDDNTRQMGRVRKNMVKLLDKSSNLCLIIVIILEIVSIVCILLLWP